MRNQIRAGDLRDLISIWHNVATKDAKYRSPVDNWVPFIAEAGSPTTATKIPAEVVDALPSKTMGSERAMGGIVLGRGVAIVRIRTIAGVTAAMRILHYAPSGNRWFSIGGIAVLGIGRQEGWELLCESFTSE